MDFSSREDFELHVHKCFGEIFKRLTSIDQIVKEGAEREEAEGKFGTMNKLRDYVEEAILHCHLAWQYHRLSRAMSNVGSWDRIEGGEKPAE